MSVASSLFSSISGYIPSAVKEAAGLSPQISEAVRRLVSYKSWGGGEARPRQTIPPWGALNACGCRLSRQK